jgi:TonB family protein
MKNGVPVRVEAQVEVNFRLLDKKDAEQVAQVGGYPAHSAATVPANSTAPVLIRKTEPEYTEEARAAHFQGTVTLSARVNTDGVPEDMRVVRSLGMGLDEKAIDAVKQWRFRPATEDGQPVASMSTIEVNFRLGAH